MPFVSVVELIKLSLCKPVSLIYWLQKHVETKQSICIHHTADPTSHTKGYIESHPTGAQCPAIVPGVKWQHPATRISTKYQWQRDWRQASAGLFAQRYLLTRIRWVTTAKGAEQCSLTYFAIKKLPEVPAMCRDQMATRL